MHSYASPPENIFSYRPWHLDAGGSGQDSQLNVCEFRAHGKGFVVRLEGISDRESAAMINNRLVTVDSRCLPSLPAGEYYWQELTGLTVFSVYGSTGQPVLLGRVSGLMETGANDVLIVAPCEGSLDQRERLLPYVDQYVLDIDLPTGRMLVDWDPEF